jgi:hypothetical protein
MEQPADLIFPPVTVHFIGICTHIHRTIQPLPTDGDLVPLNTFQRVVLVDASNGLRVEDDGIPPHSALLYVPPRFIAALPECIDGLTRIAPGLPSAWRMSGVELELEPRSPELKWGDGYACLPSLTSATTEHFELDHRVVDDGDLACVFRITGGTLAAYTSPSPEPTPPVIGKLTVGIDDWTKAQLKVTRIWSQRTSSIQLRRYGTENPHIIIANVGTTTDVKGDFTLHYLATTLAPKALIDQNGICQPPAASQEDRKALEYARVVLDATGLAEGCSNSVYP